MRWKESLEERFWKYVDKTPGHGPKGDCWIWTGKVFVKSYGIFTIKGKRVRAHRLAHELQTGAPIAEGLKVLHECDNPACVRGEHLFTGTQSDNIRMAVQRGRVIPPKRWPSQRKAVNDTLTPKMLTPEMLATGGAVELEKPYIIGERVEPCFIPVLEKKAA
jgi:HNH endonuclease